MRPLSAIFLTLTFAVGFSCSSMTKQECENKDWRAFAQRYTQTQGLDMNGLKQAALRACSEHKIYADEKQLEAGHIQGLKKYCLRETAWELGMDGENYHLSVCPEDQREELEKVHETAKILYKIEDFETKAQEARDRINELYSQISDLQKEKIQLMKDHASQQEISLVDSKVSALQIEIQREQNQKDQALMRAAQLRRQIQIHKEVINSP